MSEYADSTIFTTGQVAKICQVAPRTVTKWFDTGQLRGYRIPGSQDRRIPKKNLIQFLTENGMPLGVLGEETQPRLLLHTDDGQLVESLRKEFGEKVELLSVSSVFEAGIAAVKFQPHCIVLDSQVADDLPLLVKTLRASGNPRLSIVGFLNDEEHKTMRGHFDESFRRPFDPVLVAARLESLAYRSLPS